MILGKKRDGINGWERYRKTEGFLINKKGAELSINTLIIIILAVIVLVTMIFIFSSSAKQFAATVFTWLKNSLGMWNETQIPQTQLPTP